MVEYELIINFSRPNPFGTHLRNRMLFALRTGDAFELLGMNIFITSIDVNIESNTPDSTLIIKYKLA